MTDELKRDYKSVSLALCSAVLGLIFMRVVVYVLPLPSETYGDTLGTNALFAIVTQVIFFLVLPFCIYKFYGKRTVKQTLAFSGIGKFKAYYLLAIPLGIAAFVVTIGVSSAWTGLLKLTGYTYSPSPDELPDNFVFGFFIADILLTAVLPAVCEEFVMRGGTLTTAQNSFKPIVCVIICGVAFGLFHQNIKQVFYTTLFGMLAAYMIIKTKSIYPAMIMHFTNNFCSVFLDYADHYNWAFGGGFYDVLGNMSVWGLALVFLVAGALAAVMVALMLYIRDKQMINKKMAVIKDAAFDATNKRVILQGEFDAQRVSELEMEREVYGRDYVRPLYRPSLRDTAVIIALAVVTLLTTVFTYVWGFFY